MRRRWLSVKLETMSCQAIAQPLRDLLLQAFDFRVAKLEHRSRRDIDQVIVMPARRLLILAPALAEVVFLDDARAPQHP